VSTPAAVRPERSTTPTAGLNRTILHLLFACASVSAGVAIAVLAPGADWVLLAAVAFAVAAPVGQRVLRRRFDPFEPLVVFALAYGVMFVLRPAAMMVDGRLAHERPYGTIDLEATFTEMLVLALIGAFAFVVGYSSRAGSWLARRRMLEAPAALDPRAVTVAALAVGALGIFLAGAFVILSGGTAVLELMLAGRSASLSQTVQGSSKYLYHGSWLLIPASLTMLAVGRAHREAGVVVLGVAALAVVLLWALAIGYRMMLLPTVFGSIVYFYVAAGRRPRALTVFGFIALALVASATVLAVRNAEIRQTQGITTSVTMTATSPSRVIAPLTEGEDAAMAPLLASALALVPTEIPHMLGRGVIGELVVRPIPRQLWSNKPLPPRTQVTRALWPGRTDLQPEFSLLFYGYLDFGAIGVALALAAFGILCRALYEYFQTQKTRLSAQLFFAVGLAFVVIGLRDDPVDTFTRGMFVLAPLWIILRAGARR
jgi:hypothetical protein